MNKIERAVSLHNNMVSRHERKVAEGQQSIEDGFSSAFTLLHVQRGKQNKVINGLIAGVNRTILKEFITDWVDYQGHKARLRGVQTFTQEGHKDTIYLEFSYEKSEKMPDGYQGKALTLEKNKSGQTSSKTELYINKEKIIKPKTQKAAMFLLEEVNSLILASKRLV